MNGFKIVIAILCFVLPAQIQYAGFGAFSAQQASSAEQQAVNKGAATPATPSTGTPTTPSNCPACPSSGTSSYVLPSFNIVLGNQTGTTLTTHAFSVPSTFNLNNFILTVHIFPMSNSISNSTITYATTKAEGSYLVSYVLADPTGSIVHTEFDQGLALSSMPHQITLVANTPTAPTAGAPTTSATFSTTTGNVITQSIFIPQINTSTYTQANRQQILNGISPIAQKFYIQVDNSGNATATPISGTFYADNTTAGTLALASDPLSAPTGPSGSAIMPITLQFQDTTLLTFDNSSLIQFNQADLLAGILLNVVIYPSEQANSYPVVATLRSSDGLKYRKKYALPPPTTGTPPANAVAPLSSIPTNITIQYNSQSLLTTSFLNSAIASMNNAFTMITPLNLRFVILQDATTSAFNVIMM